MSPGKSLNVTLNTNYAYRLRVESSTKKSLCLLDLSVREHGQYLVTIRSGSDTNLECEVTVRRVANNVSVPLIVGMILVVVLFFGCIIAKRFNVVDRLTALKNQCLKRRPIQESARTYNLQATVAGTTAEPSLVKASTSDEVILPKPTKTKRLLCLDAFRGFGKGTNENAALVSRLSSSSHCDDLRQLRRRWLRSVRTRSLARNHLCRYRLSILRLDAGYVVGHFVEERLGQEYSQANLGDEDWHSHFEIIRM